MEKPTIIRKVALEVFKDGQILMVRSHKNEAVFYTLGGKVEQEETDEECLHREVMEEASARIKHGSLKFLHEFEAPAHGKVNTLVNVQMYQGELLDDPKPSSEIAEVRYFDSSIAQKHLAPLTELIFPRLKAEGLIK